MAGHSEDLVKIVDELKHPFTESTMIRKDDVDPSAEDDAAPNMNGLWSKIWHHQDHQDQQQTQDQPTQNKKQEQEPEDVNADLNLLISAGMQKQTAAASSKSSDSQSSAAGNIDIFDTPISSQPSKPAEKSFDLWQQLWSEGG